MKESLGYLYDYLSILNQREKAKFKNWLNLELAGKDQIIGQWYEQIHEGNNQAQAWERLFPNKTFQRKEIARWENRILGQLELFMSIEAFREDTNSQKLYLNRFVIRRGAEVCYPHAIRKTRKKLKKQPERDYHYFRIHHELDRLDKEFRLTYPNIKIRRYKQDPKEIELNQKRFIILNQLEVILSNHKKELNERQKKLLDDTDKILPSPTETPLDQYSSDDVVIYFYRVLIDYYFPTPIFSPEQVELLTKLFKKAAPNLRPDARGNLFRLIYNGLVVSLNQGNNRQFYIEELIKLNNWFTKHRELIINGRLYCNQVSLYIQLANFPSQTAEDQAELITLAEEFSWRYREKLPQKEQKDLYAYNQAQIFFAKGEYQDLIKLWQQYQRGKIELKESHFDINFEILYLKSLDKTWHSFQEKHELKTMLEEFYRRISKSKTISIKDKKVYKGALKVFLKRIRQDLKQIKTY